MIEPPLERSSVQESIFRALQREDPALADFYDGARLLVIAQTPMPGQAWFVGHALREIVEHIPRLAGVTRGSGFNCGERLEGLALQQERNGLPDKEVMTLLAKMVQGNRGYRNRRDRLQAAFAKLVPHIGPARHREWAKAWRVLYDENSNRAHTGKPWPAPGDEREAFRHLESLLAGIFGEYAPNRQELDDFLDKANRRGD